MCNVNGLLDSNKHTLSLEQDCRLIFLKHHFIPGPEIHLIHLDHFVQKIDIKQHHTSSYHPVDKATSSHRAFGRQHVIWRLITLKDDREQCRTTALSTAYYLNNCFHPSASWMYILSILPTTRRRRCLVYPCLPLSRLHRDWMAAYRLMKGLSEDVKVVTNQHRPPIGFEKVGRNAFKVKILRDIVQRRIHDVLMSHTRSIPQLWHRKYFLWILHSNRGQASSPILSFRMNHKIYGLCHQKWK